MGGRLRQLIEAPEPFVLPRVAGLHSATLVEMAGFTGTPGRIFSRNFFRIISGAIPALESGAAMPREISSQPERVQFVSTGSRRTIGVVDPPRRSSTATYM